MQETSGEILIIASIEMKVLCWKESQLHGLQDDTGQQHITYEKHGFS
jgi:hypothetical protein